MNLKKLLSLLFTAVIAASALSCNVFSYFNGVTIYTDATKAKIGNMSYILRENVYYGNNVKISYSATVVEIPNIQKVEIPEKVSYNGLEYMVTDVDLYGKSEAESTKPNIYPDVEEVVLPDTIYNITELANFPNLRKINIPKNAAIGRAYDDVFNDNRKVVKTYYSDFGKDLPEVHYDFLLYEEHIYFTNCPKLKLTVDTYNPYYSYKNDMLLSKYGKNVFMSFNHSSDVTIPDGVERLMDLGGFGFQNFKNVKLPESLKYLCVSLPSVTKIILPNGLEEIGMYAFANCQITEITLPKNLKTIACGAFKNTKLTKIVIPDNVKEIDEEAFANSNIKSVKFGSKVVSIGDKAFENCKKLKSVTIPQKVKNISWAVFRKCKSLKSVKITSKKVEILNQAFAKCTNLKSVTVNEANIIVGGAFNNCKKLSKIVFNNKKKAPKVLNGGFKNTKNGLKFVVKNKKVAKQLNKQLSKKKFKRNLKNAKIKVGKKTVY